MDADGTHRRQLTRSGADIQLDPSWAPDGKRIVFPDLVGHRSDP